MIILPLYFYNPPGNPYLGLVRSLSPPFVRLQFSLKDILYTPIIPFFVHGYSVLFM